MIKVQYTSTDSYASSARVRNVWGINKSFAWYFDVVFVPVSWISRRESSGYIFATTAQMYEVF